MVNVLVHFSFCVFQIFLLFNVANGKIHHQKFVVKSSSYTRLCSTKEILTVNGRFPGPTLKARRGDKIIITVYNKANYNITFHWHGVRQVRNSWSDGPECSARFSQETSTLTK
ncbi:hypothetical protein FF1_020074 [Malus domestica]